MSQVDEWISSMFRPISMWHLSGRTWEFTDLAEWIAGKEPLIKLAHCDYVMWHQIERFPDQIVPAMLTNKRRNEAMDAFDSWYVANRPESGAVNTETMGSVLDRIVNHEIKRLHLVESGDPRLRAVTDQLEWLIAAANGLDAECRTGARRCVPFSRFKVGYPEG